MVAPLATLLVSDAITHVKRQFGDESGVQIIDSDVIRWVNMAQREIISKTHFLKATASSMVVSGQQTYTLPADIVDIEAVQVGNFVLQRTTFSDAVGTMQMSAMNSGSPVYYWEYAGSINFFPVPNNSTDTLTIYYACVPIQVTTASNLLSIPDRYFEPLCNFVLSKAYELDEDLQGMNAQRVMFEQSIQNLKEAENEVNGAFQVITEVGYY